MMRKKEHRELADLLEENSQIMSKLMDVAAWGEGILDLLNDSTCDINGVRRGMRKAELVAGGEPGLIKTLLKELQERGVKVYGKNFQAATKLRP